jgi:hypothetical protein
VWDVAWDGAPFSALPPDVLAGFIDTSSTDCVEVVRERGEAAVPLEGFGLESTNCVTLN